MWLFGVSGCISAEGIWSATKDAGLMKGARNPPTLTWWLVLLRVMGRGATYKESGSRIVKMNFGMGDKMAVIFAHRGVQSYRGRQEFLDGRDAWSSSR